MFYGGGYLLGGVDILINCGIHSVCLYPLVYGVSIMLVDCVVFLSYSVMLVEWALYNVLVRKCSDSVVNVV